MQAESLVAEKYAAAAEVDAATAAARDRHDQTESAITGLLAGIAQTETELAAISGKLAEAISAEQRLAARAEVLARYKKKYADGPDGQAGMGQLSFDIEDARGDDRYATVALRWTLTWPNKPKATGLSLVVLESHGLPSAGVRWLVVHDASM
jgi:hypothetical protein